MKYEEAYDLLDMTASTSQAQRHEKYLECMERLKKKKEQSKDGRIWFLMDRSIETLQQAHQLIEVHQAVQAPPLPSLADAIQHASQDTSIDVQLEVPAPVITQQVTPPPLPPASAKRPRHIDFIDKLKQRDADIPETESSHTQEPQTEFNSPGHTYAASETEAHDPTNLEALTNAITDTPLQEDEQHAPRMSDALNIKNPTSPPTENYDLNDLSEAEYAPVTNRVKSQQVKIPWERIFGAWAPVWIGGLIIAIGGIFLAQYMYVNAMLPIELRLSAAGLFGAALITVGTLLHRRMGAFCQALTIPGLATTYATTWGVVYFYSETTPWLVWPSIALMIGITLLSVRLSMQQGPFVAIFSLLSGLISPALIGHTDPHPIAMFAYLAIIQYGMTHLAISKQWHWLHMLTSAGCLIWATIWAYAYQGGAYIEWAGAFTLISSIGSLMTTTFFGRHTQCEDTQRLRRMMLQDQALVHVLSVVTITMLVSFITFSQGSAWTWIYFFAFNAIAYTLAIRKQLLAGYTWYIPFVSSIAMLVGMYFNSFTINIEWAPNMLAYTVFLGHLLLFGLLPVIIGHRQSHKEPWSITGLLISALFIMSFMIDPITPFTTHPIITCILSFFIAAYHILVSIPNRINEQTWLNQTVRQIQLHTGYCFAVFASFMIIDWEFLLLTGQHNTSLTPRYLMSGIPMSMTLLAVLTAVCHWGMSRLTLKNQLDHINIAIHAVLALLQIGVAIWLFNQQGSAMQNLSVIALAFFPALLSTLWASLPTEHTQSSDTPHTPAFYYTCLSSLSFMVSASLIILGLIHGFASFSELGFIEGFQSLRFNALLWFCTAMIIYLVSDKLKIKYKEQLVTLFKAAGFVALVPMTLAYFTQYNSEVIFSALPDWCSLFLDTLLPTAICISFIVLLKKQKEDAWIVIRRIDQVFATVLSLVGSTLILHLSFNAGNIAFTQIPQDGELYGYTILWSVYAIVMLTIGIITNSLFARWSSLLILMITISKLLLLDTHELQGLYRIFAFIGTGLLLVGIGYVYHKFVFKGQVFVNQKRSQKNKDSHTKPKAHQDD